MKIIIDKTQSKLMDYICSLDNYNYEDIKPELSPYEMDILKPIFDDLASLKAIREKYQYKLDKYHFNINTYSLIQKLYLKLLNDGKNPLSIKELFTMLSDYSLEEKRLVLIGMISDKRIDSSNFDAFFALIEEEIDDQKDKWRSIWIYQNMEKSLDELEKIYDEFLPYYETFYKKYEEDIDKMIADFDIYKFYENSPVDFEKILDNLKTKTIRVFVRSSLNLNMIMNGHDGILDVYIYPSSKEILDKRKSFDNDILNLAIKALSDPIRYDILREVTSSNLMNKEIAEKLAITPANVSFHIQKLINANLVKISMEDSGVKYKVNKELIKTLISKFEIDLL